MFSLQRQVYLDNNATTPLSRSVQKSMQRVLKQIFGNPSSTYRMGRSAARLMQESRSIIADTIGANTEDLIFTSSATEANNYILKSLSEFFLAQGKRKIISSPLEHPSIMSTLEYLENQGVVVDYLKVDSNGFISLEHLEALIDNQTFLVCCMLANNEIGTIQDMAGICDIAHQNQIPVMSDCVQALAKIDVNIGKMGIDFASFSAHKIHGPKGIGVACLNSSFELPSFIHGGHQEVGKRAGTEGLHNIVGFAEACKAVPELLQKQTQVESLKQKFIKDLTAIKSDVIINSVETDCLPNTLSVRFPGVNNAVLMASLDMHGISVSAGSACSSAGTSPSHVLINIGLSEEEAGETIRFSLSESTSEKQLQYVVGILANIFAGKTPEIQAIKARQLDRTFIEDQQNYLLDVRFWHERQMLKGLPLSHEVSFLFFRRYVKQIPKDRHIIVVCMAGIDATGIAFSLKKRGYENVSFVLGGVVAWRIAQAHLYKEMAGKDITKLLPD